MMFKPNRRIEIKPPPMVNRLRSFGGAVSRIVSHIKDNKRVMVEPTEANRRFDMCKQCDLFIESKQMCSKCGCFMKYKTMLLTEKCPIDKW